MLQTFIHNILEFSSPSGFEENVTKAFEAFVTPYVDEIIYDVHGNCIAHKFGSGEKVMFVAHADEIGLMISYIDNNGFLFFKEIGGVDTNLLPGKRVKISGTNGPIIGIIGKKPIHLQDRNEGSKELNPEDLWIDIAAKDKADAMTKVQIGAPATVISEPHLLSSDLIVSRSLDDKIGLMVLAGVSQNLKEIETNKDIYLVASVQEELGARGVQTSAQSILPDVGIAIDVTHATDYPTMSPIKDGDISLGKGVVIPIGPNMNKQLNKVLISIAETNKIPYQLEAISRPTGTDAKVIQLVGRGVRTGLLSIPCRYMHSPNEIVSISDAKSTIQLLTEYLKTNQC